MSFFPVWEHQAYLCVLQSFRFSIVATLTDTVSSVVKMQNASKQTIVVVFLPDNV